MAADFIQIFIKLQFVAGLCSIGFINHTTVAAASFGNLLTHPYYLEDSICFLLILAAIVPFVIEVKVFIASSFSVAVAAAVVEAF